MLLDNTEKVMNLVDMVDSLDGVNKVRLAIHLFETLELLKVEETDKVGLDQIQDVVR